MKSAGPAVPVGWRRGVYVGLGANLGPDPGATMLAAIEALDREPGLGVMRCSRLYRAPPWGPIPQPDYVNAVVELMCMLPTIEVVGRLLAVERDLGRRREGPRFGPRTIDLDLLLDGAAVVDAPGVSVPHPRIALRAFVLVPLAELDPEAVVPGIGCVRELLAALGPEAEHVSPLGVD